MSSFSNKRSENTENMFFDEILVQNKVLGKVWRAGNDQITAESDESSSLPKICENLDTWVDSDSMDARRRLSLRTSSILIDGAAKLYKKGIQKLVKDVAKLDEEMVLRNRRDPNSSEEDPDPVETTSGSYEIPEQMMRRAETHPDISFEVPRESTLSPLVDKSLSFINRNKDSCSTQSLKRKSNECIDSNAQSSKRRLYDSDQPRELHKSPYPSSLTSISSNHQTDSVSSDQQTESQSESDQTVDSQPVKTRPTKSSDDSSLNKQISKNNSDHKSNSRKAVESSSDTDKNTSKSSPTFTEIFDFVACLPNNNDATRIMTEKHANGIRNDTDSDTSSTSDKSITIERIYDNRIVASDKTSANGNTDSNCRSSDKGSNTANGRTATKENSKESSHVESQRSIILQSAKNSFPKLPRNKKGLKAMRKQKNQTTQTVSFHHRMSDREADAFDENLPFGYLLIHDTIHSRIPSKIVFSSLNANVNNLFGL